MTMLNAAMAWDRLVPPERAGDVRLRAPLEVQPLRRLELEELLVLDDDLPQADGATLFWLERKAERWRAWAAKVDGPIATPWLILAARLRLERPDAALLALIGADSADGLGVDAEASGEARALEPMPRQLACICRDKSAEAIYRSADEGWNTVEEVKRRTGVAFGECQGRRCVPVVAKRLDQQSGARGSMITPRPPLVPVPASILAAFAEADGPP